MKRRYKIAAIDFDGVIKPTIENNKYDPPTAECIETLKALKAAGWKLVLWTCRAGRNLKAATNYLKKHGLLHLFDAINNNVHPIRYKTSQKVIATVYIDDRVIGGFPGWNVVRKELLQRD
ncbi:MAG: hydrolase [Deltaproteobacteria bacterium]|nr:hydrolase [Deltaproteobacteria bacterium]